MSHANGRRPVCRAGPSLPGRVGQWICFTWPALFSIVLKSGMTAISHSRIADGVTEMVSHLDNIGYFKLQDERKWTEQLLKDITERAALSESEMQRFEKIFRKTELIALHRRNDDA